MQKRKKTLLIIFVLIAVSFLFENVYATIYIYDNDEFYINIYDSWITFDSSICPVGVETLEWNSTHVTFDTSIVSSSVNFTFTAFHSSNWLNYTVVGAGNQTIDYSETNYIVYFDNVENVSGSGGWTVSGTTLTVTGGTVDVSIFYGDAISPTYSGLSNNSTIAGNIVQFQATFDDNFNLHPNGQWNFGTNNTGVWVWDGVNNFTTTSQTNYLQKTLNSTVGVRVEYMWNFTDNSQNSNTTGIQGFTTTTDQIQVVSYAISDSRINIGEYALLNATLIYVYDSAPVVDGTVTFNGTSATHLGSGVWQINVTSSSILGITYNTVATSGNARGVTDVDQNGQSQLVVWDAVMLFLSIEDNRMNVDDLVYANLNATYGFDGTSIVDGTIQLNGTNMEYQSSSWWRLNMTQSSVGQYTYVVDSVSGNTEGITELGIINLDGDSDRFVIPDDPDFAFSSGFTLAAWAKPTAVDTLGVLFYQYDAITNDGFLLLQTATGKWNFQVYQGGASDTIESNDNATTDWQHVVAMREEDGTLKMYLNGVLQTDTGTQTGVVDSTASIYVGSLGLITSSDFDGYFCEHRFYNRSLQEPEIYQLYQGRYTNDTGLVALYSRPSYDMDDSLWRDLSGNGHNGVINNVTVTLGTSTDETIRPIWDGLVVSDLQSPAFLDNGAFSYEAKLSYAYDSEPVDGGTIRVVHANGTELATDFTTNSTGYSSVVLGQANSSLAGTYIIIGDTDPLYSLTLMYTNVSFIVDTLTLQARDAASTNLPRSVVFTLTSGGQTFGAFTSSTSGLSTIYAPDATTYGIVATWGTHTIYSVSIPLTDNSTALMNTKIERLTDGSNYILMSLDNTDMKRPVLFETDDVIINDVVASGNIEFKADHLNWKVTTEPDRLTVGGGTYDSTSPTWSWASSILTLTPSFSGTQTLGLDFTYTTPPSSGGGGGGGGVTPPSIEPEEPTEPEEPVIPEEPTGLPKSVQDLNLQEIGLIAIVGLVAATALTGATVGKRRRTKANPQKSYEKRNKRKKTTPDYSKRPYSS